ncbi:MAG: hypothetical protein GXO75_10615 [Calditrichaeota bacterium]|nr:hypothetical protein [Calditrichota bacterium]
MDFLSENILLTGEKGVGKSTLISTILDSISVPYQGLFTERIFKGQGVYGFGLKNERERSLKIFAYENNFKKDGYYRYLVDIDAFENRGHAILSSVRPETKLFVIDEIGIMEREADRFLERFWQLLQSPLPLLAVVQKRAKYIWDQVDSNSGCRIFEITRENRDSIAKNILLSLNEILSRSKHYRANF